MTYAPEPATLAAPGSAQATPGKANPTKTCSERGDTIFGFPGEPPSTRGGCASYVATGEDGDPTGAGYAAQCKDLTGGEYPFTFYGEVTVDNPVGCKDALRTFHTTPPSGGVGGRGTEAEGGRGHGHPRPSPCPPNVLDGSSRERGQGGLRTCADGLSWSQVDC